MIDWKLYGFAIVILTSSALKCVAQEVASRTNYAPALLAPSPHQAERMSSPALPVAEQDVIEGLLRDPEGLFGGREEAVWEIAGGTNVDFNGSYEQARKWLAREKASRDIGFSQAVEDMLKKNPTAARIGLVQSGWRPIHLIPPTSFPSLFSDNDTSYDEWGLFYERFPQCPRIVTLSRVGFDANGTEAVLVYGLNDPSRPPIVRFQVLKRVGKQWGISESRQAVWPRGSPTVALTCELRYYVKHDYAESDGRLRLQVIENSGTNLVCSVPKSFRLVKTNDGPADVAGWVLQVTGPPEYAGQPLTALLDDFYPPFVNSAFRFERRYDVAIPKEMIGDLSFNLRF